MIVTIIDYCTTSTNIISLDDDVSVPQKLQELGYRLGDIEYMVSNNLNLRIDI